MLNLRVLVKQFLLVLFEVVERAIVRLSEPVLVAEDVRALASHLN